MRRWKRRRARSGPAHQGLPQTVAFHNGVGPTGAYAGTRDTFVDDQFPAQNFGGADPLDVDGDHDNGFRRWMLIQWDVSVIPGASTVTGAELVLEVANSTDPPGYGLYEMKRPWAEMEATWDSYATGPWEVPGGDGSADRGLTALGVLVPTADGPYRLPLNAEGLALVQQWVNDPATNRGIFFYEPTVSSGARCEGG